MFSALEEYAKKNGHCFVPYDMLLDDGKKLADFIKRFYPMVYPSANEIEYVTPAI